MKFPEDAPVTREKLDFLRERLARLQIDLSRVDEQAVKGTGPGGQKVNKTQSGVLLRYSLVSVKGNDPESEAEQVLVKWTRERKHSLNRFLALRELADEIEERISPETSERVKERARIRKQKDRQRRRQSPQDDT